MILKIWAKAGVPKTLVQQKRRLHSLYFPQNTLMLTESRGEFSDLHSNFRLRVLRYCWAPLWYIDRLRVIYFILFHSKRQHKHGLRTVNISQHCTFVSGVSLTRARVKYYLTLIIFAKGNRSPGKNRVTWSVPGCQEMLLNGCWMKSFVIDVFVI